MTAPSDKNRFLVSRILATVAGATFLTTVAIAGLVAGVAQISTCFGSHTQVASPESRTLLVSADTSLATHDGPVLTLRNVWAMTGHSEPPQIAVVRSDDINAASLGGGRFLIWEGLTALPRPLLDGVFSHEVAHDLLHHARKASELQDVLDFVGEAVGTLGHASDDATDSTVHRWARNAVLPKYSRAQEYQADSLGAVLLSRIEPPPI